MSENKNRVTVVINDQHYTIIGEDDSSHIRYVAGRVDEKIKALGQLNAGLDTTRKSVLTAVNVMHEYVKLEEENEKLQEEIKQLKNKGNLE
ncbi:cell division protein ZapA [Mammaliicoccus lentus]|uniref:cell division protein ZapA n=1 Tax=Mammaliicoccus lentus TaxID=42858 RepID=UPI003CEF64E0